MRTKAGNCLDVISRLDKLGNEDANLPFTMYGFNNFIKPAHFQYYMGAVEASCNEEKSARKRWAKVAKMNDALPSPEFVFPILAAWKISRCGCPTKTARSFGRRGHCKKQNRRQK